MDEKGFFFFPCRVADEQSKPKLLCQEDAQSKREKASEGNNWIGFIGKLWFVFMCMCQVNRWRDKESGRARLCLFVSKFCQEVTVYVRLSVSFSVSKLSDAYKCASQKR